MKAGINKKIVVVGGNDAGLSAAGRAKREAPSLEVVVLEKTGNISYASCGLPYYIARGVEKALVAGPSPAEIAEKRGLEILTHHDVLAIDTRKRILCVKSIKERKEIDIPYSKLVLATGAIPQIPENARISARNVFVMRNFSDAEKLDDYIVHNKPKNALVLGAGFLGLEMAEALTQRDLCVTLVEKTQRILPRCEAVVSERVTDAIAARGIRLHMGDDVLAFSMENDRIVCASLARENRKIDVDLVFLATGIRPNTDLAAQAGIPLGQTGAIAVSNTQQTRRMDIFAAGDCCEARDIVSKNWKWFPYAAVATKQGRVAGDQIAGGNERFPGALGSTVTKVFDLEFGYTGLDQNSALLSGFSPMVSVISQDAKSEYISDNCKITIVLVADAHTKRLLGAQIVGERDAGLRLHALATAITAGMTVTDLAYLDFGYMPAVTHLWDPIIVGGQVAKKKMRRR